MEDSRHKSIEKNNFFLFTKKKIQILDAVNKIHNLFPLESVFHQLFFCDKAYSQNVPKEQSKEQFAATGCLAEGNSCKEI